MGMATKRGIKCKEFSRNDTDFLEAQVFRKGCGVPGILISIKY